MTFKITAAALALATALPTMTFAQTDNAQYAASIGVNADNYTLSELVELDKALRDNDREKANLVLSEAGSEMTYEQLQAGMTANGMTMSDIEAPEMEAAEVETYSGGKEQIAAVIGVDAEDFTLNELVGLKAAVDTGDEDAAQAILDRAGVEGTAASLM
ncbi:hypothetical protein [Meridianimarinicoccus aquatilis]|uniref:DUF4142 domain-containing protein n=1 Tax=Meridianimarinicoccus aquatilis TaxID=2552766 RepID=A0A4R6ARC1_9RHOB|nr:hypothetical protein [Fluviibacterium aquatile]TDL86102.1 hypothetical protein E2L05_14095 [Fluviibacterium aquatile]